MPDPTASYEPTPPPAGGQRFAAGDLLAGRYRVVAPLGAGGMGEVYRADDLTLGQPVALKFLPAPVAADPSRLDQFRKETAAARRVAHPNVCRVYDIADHAGQPFLTMEFIDGEDLAGVLRRVGRVPEEKGVEIARQLCAALAAVHDQGLLHRDLKPANVMLDGRGRVRLTDFGLAAAADDATADARAGTPAYQAPEQLAGHEVTARSDLFALGLVLFEVFTGRKAFPAATRAELAARYEGGLSSKPSSHVGGLEPAVERVILKCLEPDPANRPRSAAEVLAALPGGDPLAAALAAGVTPSPRLVADAGEVGLIRPWVGAALLAAAVAGLAGWLAVYPYAMLVGRVPLPKSPDALAHDARAAIQAAGYADQPVRAYGFEHDERYLNWVGETDRTATRWDRLASPQPAALYYWYRHGPAPLVPAPDYPSPATLEPGQVTPTDPPARGPGTVTVRLDATGRLIGFVAVPPEDAPAAPGATDWAALFAAAGIDPGRVREEPRPGFVPPVYADERRAWVGAFEGRPEVAARVEAAAVAGRPVYFRVAGPWSTRDDAGPAPTAGDAVYAGYYAALLAAAVGLAPLNLLRGRADRAGAGRLAGLVFGLVLLAGLFATRHTADVRAELRLLVLGAAVALWWAGFVWLAYVALEPFARRFLPEMLISWTRLLDGRLRDPRVGRDVLIGVAAGVAVQLAHGVADHLVPGWAGVPPPPPMWDRFVPDTFAPGGWTGNALLTPAYAVRTAVFAGLFPYLLFRLVFRRAWAAGVALVLVTAARWVQEMGSPPAAWPLHLLAFGLMLYVLLRWGLLAAVVLTLVENLLWFPMTRDASAFYFRDGLLIGAIVVGLAGYGFYHAADLRRLLLHGGHGSG